MFVHKTDKRLVVKVAHRHLSGENNRMEWEIYHNAPKHIRKWLVPPVSIHEKDAYMVCLRGKPVTEIPREHPFKEVFHDMLLPENWVTIKGKPMLADYANTQMYNLYGRK